MGFYKVKNNLWIVLINEVTNDNVCYSLPLSSRPKDLHYCLAVDIFVPCRETDNFSKIVFKNVQI